MKKLLVLVLLLPLFSMTIAQDDLAEDSVDTATQKEVKESKGKMKKAEMKAKKDAKKAKKKAKKEAKQTQRKAKKEARKAKVKAKEVIESESVDQE